MPALSERWTSLSKRFGDARASALRQEDGHGKCRGIIGLGWEKRDYSGDEQTTATRGDSVDPVIVRWYTGKQTNRGWPGTAEGKINTAQGMAGDLVSNLDSEEKSDVAGIYSSE